jgi:hypothetical protein
MIGVMTHSPTPNYAEVLAPMPGRCFRFVSGGEGGGPTHCPEPPPGEACSESLLALTRPPGGRHLGRSRPARVHPTLWAARPCPADLLALAPTELAAAVVLETLGTRRGRRAGRRLQEQFARVRDAARAVQALRGSP